MQGRLPRRAGRPRTPRRGDVYKRQIPTYLRNRHEPDKISYKTPQLAHILDAVSYTHLDVYKRQVHTLHAQAFIVGEKFYLGKVLFLLDVYKRQAAGDAGKILSACAGRL